MMELVRERWGGEGHVTQVERVAGGEVVRTLGSHLLHGHELSGEPGSVKPPNINLLSSKSNLNIICVGDIKIAAIKKTERLSILPLHRLCIAM